MAIGHFKIITRNIQGANRRNEQKWKVKGVTSGRMDEEGNCREGSIVESALDS